MMSPISEIKAPFIRLPLNPLSIKANEGTWWVATMILSALLSNVEKPAVFIETDGHKFQVGDSIAPLKLVKGAVVGGESGYVVEIGSIDVNEDSEGKILSFSIGCY